MSLRHGGGHGVTKTFGFWYFINLFNHVIGGYLIANKL